MSGAQICGLLFLFAVTGVKSGGLQYFDHEKHLLNVTNNYYSHATSELDLSLLKLRDIPEELLQVPVGQVRTRNMFKIISPAAQRRNRAQFTYLRPKITSPEDGAGVLALLRDVILTLYKLGRENNVIIFKHSIALMHEYGREPIMMVGVKWRHKTAEWVVQYSEIQFRLTLHEYRMLNYHIGLHQADLAPPLLDLVQGLYETPCCLEVARPWFYRYPELLMLIKCAKPDGSGFSKEELNGKPYSYQNFSTPIFCNLGLMTSKSLKPHTPRLDTFELFVQLDKATLPVTFAMQRGNPTMANIFNGKHYTLKPLVPYPRPPLFWGRDDREPKCAKTIWRAPFRWMRGNRQTVFPWKYPEMRHYAYDIHAIEDECWERWTLARAYQLVDRRNRKTTW